MLTVELWGGPRDGEEVKVAEPAPRDVRILDPAQLATDWTWVNSDDPIAPEVLVQLLYVKAGRRRNGRLVYRFRP